jgi:hypothetical protein
MRLEKLELTATEELLLRRSSDLGLTRRRLRLVVMSGLLLAAALIVTSPLMRSWEFLLFFSVAYILITTWERVGYARTVMAYKSLIAKLYGRIEKQGEQSELGQGSPLTRDTRPQ